jgi:programmed cell death 6-interacting protein
LLYQALDLLDQEITEEEQMLQRYPELSGKIEQSAVTNRQWLEKADHFRGILKQVRKSDAEVRLKWDQWAPLVTVLAGGEVSQRSFPVNLTCRRRLISSHAQQESLLKHIPTSGRSAEPNVELPAAARPLQTLLEDLDDARAYRTRLVAEARRVASRDDIRAQVLDTSTRLSKGSPGDIKPEVFEDLFEQELRKYRRLAEEMQENVRQEQRMWQTLGV